MTREELENIETLRELTSDTDVLEALIQWLPTDNMNEFIKDFINDYDLEIQYIDGERE